MHGYGNLKPIEGKILDNIHESKNSIYLTEKNDIVDEIRRIIKNESNNNIYLGLIGDNAASKIKKDIGIDVFNYRVAILKSDAIHWYNRHVLNYAKMIPMKLDDILKFIDLFDNYDLIEKRPSKDKTKLLFSGEIEGRITNISVISTGKNRIIFKTLYYIKKK